MKGQQPLCTCRRNTGQTGYSLQIFFKYEKLNLMNGHNTTGNNKKTTWDEQ